MSGLLIQFEISPPAAASGITDSAGHCSGLRLVVGEAMAAALVAGGIGGVSGISSPVGTGHAPGNDLCGKEFCYPDRPAGPALGLAAGPGTGLSGLGLGLEFVGIGFAGQCGGSGHPLDAGAVACVYE